MVDESKDLSGFVRDDIVNWSAKLPVLIEDITPSYIVVMVGANDRRSIRLEETQLKRQSPEWFTTYGERRRPLFAITESHRHSVFLGRIAPGSAVNP